MQQTSVFLPLPSTLPTSLPPFSPCSFHLCSANIFFAALIFSRTFPLTTVLHTPCSVNLPSNPSTRPSLALPRRLSYCLPHSNFSVDSPPCILHLPPFLLQSCFTLSFLHLLLYTYCLCQLPPSLTLPLTAARNGHVERFVAAHSYFVPLLASD